MSVEVIFIKYYVPMLSDNSSWITKRTMEQGLSLGIDRVEDGIVVNIRRSAIVIDTETIFMSTDFGSSVRNPGINTPMQESL
jgi:hypothetical protein